MTKSWIQDGIPQASLSSWMIAQDFSRKTHQHTALVEWLLKVEGAAFDFVVCQRLGHTEVAAFLESLYNDAPPDREP